MVIATWQPNTWLTGCFSVKVTIRSSVARKAGKSAAWRRPGKTVSPVNRIAVHGS